MDSSRSAKATVNRKRALGQWKSSPRPLPASLLSTSTTTLWAPPFLVQWADRGIRSSSKVQWLVAAIRTEDLEC